MHKYMYVCIYTIVYTCINAKIDKLMQLFTISEILSYIVLSIMPHFKLSHEENRAKICAVCYGRSGSKATQRVTAILEQGLRSLVFSDYRVSDERFPSGVCTTCRLSLLENMKGSSLGNRDAPRKMLLPDPDCYEVKLSKVTRSFSAQECQCMICVLARMNGLEWKRFVADCKKEKSDFSPGVKYDRLCSNCFSPIYRGSHHTEDACRSRRQAFSNLTVAVSNANTSMELVASNFLKTTSSEAQSSTVALRQSTGGRHPLVVTIGSPESDVTEPISADEVKVIQTEARLSDNQMGSVLKNLRLKFGRKIAESAVRETLISEKTKFDEFFSADLLQFWDNDGSYILKPVVFCSNVVDFVSELMDLRKLGPGDAKLKVGLDKGRGHLKMVLSMYNPDDVMKMKSEGRVTMKSGIGSGDNHSLIGKKKIMILAIVPDIPENYHNLQILYDLTKINSVSYQQTGDLKALNILLGLMSSSAACGCCYCEAQRNSDKWMCGGARLRSVESLSENLEKFEKSGRDKTKAKDVSANVIEKSLLFDEDDLPSMLVLEKCPPPALHLKLSLNHILVELSKAWPPLLDWLRSKHIVLEPYHGGHTLEGNECNKVLANLDSLAEVLPSQFSAFMDTLLSFKEVVSSCFGFLLDPYFKDVLSRFRQYFKVLNRDFQVSITNKIHIISTHVEQFCELTGKGLAEFSEQETENAHTVFDDTWTRYKVKDSSSSVYHQQYFKATMDFNSKNV